MEFGEFEMIFFGKKGKKNIGKEKNFVELVFLSGMEYLI